jgi:glycosyltransferase involved in cell wall biosynthesis
MRKVEQVIAVSENVKADIEKTGVTRNNLSVIPNGIDLDRWKERNGFDKFAYKRSLGVEANSTIIGIFGRLSREKGHKYLIEAIRNQRSEVTNLEVLVVGDGPLRDQLVTLYSKYQVSDKFRFLGFRKDVKELFAITNIFIMPSIGEGLPIALLEAMAMKRAIIATKVGAIPKLIENDVSGIIVEKKDVGGLTENQLKNVRIYKTAKIPNFRDMYLSLKRIYLKTHKKKDLNQSIQAWRPEERTKFEPIFTKIKRYFNSLFVWLPDDKTGWILPATIAGTLLIKKHKIDAILTTSPPNSVHLIGLVLKIITRRTWIVDFRDPWAVENKPFFVRSTLSDTIERWLCQKVIENSDRVISVTPEMTRMFEQHYQDISKEKFHTIWNGYDPEELERHSHVEKYDKFTITYAGTFYLDRNPELLLQSLADLIREGRIDRNSLHVRFFGDCRYINGESVKELVTNLNLKDIVIISDPIPHAEILQEIAKSHVLLLLAPNQPLQIPAKVFEYIGLQSSIIAICGEGATMNLLKGYPKAITIPPGNMTEMKKALLALYENSTRDTRDLSLFHFHEFEHNKLAREMADLLNGSIRKQIS